MVKEVESGEEATRIAEAFLKKRRYFPRPIKAMREKDNWLVELDVGLLDTKIARMKIDAQSGKIIEYDISPN